MPVKRPHKKSRYGCDQCRSRRVKCDEQQPQCGTCVDRKEECHFTRKAVSPRTIKITTFSTLTQTSNRGASPQDSSSDAPTNNETFSHSTSAIDAKKIDLSDIRIRELELMHHWCTKTCFSFTSLFADLFRDHVAREALRYDYIMEALLALASLHITIEMDDTAAARIRLSAALQYQNRAAAGMRNALANLSPANCEAVTVCSLLLMICALVSPLIPTGEHDQIVSTAEAMIAPIDFVKGIGSIVRQHPQLTVQGPLTEFFAAEAKKLFCLKRPFPVQHLRTLNDSALQDPAYDIFADAIEKIQQLFDGEISSIPWLRAVKSEYLEELRKGTTMALAIFMYWGVFLGCGKKIAGEEVWWAVYSAKKLVGEISLTLMARGPEWTYIAKQCRVGVELDE